jgi:hypothetical protein
MRCRKLDPADCHASAHRFAVSHDRELQRHELFGLPAKTAKIDAVSVAKSAAYA